MALDLKQEAISELDQYVLALKSIENRLLLAKRQAFNAQMLAMSAAAEALRNTSNRRASSPTLEVKEIDTKNVSNPSVEADIEETDFLIKSFLIRLYGKSSHEYSEYLSMNSNSTKVSIDSNSTKMGFLAGVRKNLSENRIYFREIAAAEIFSDFLEMAEHLLEENYKDPAAVLVGSVLEEHLRKLCVKNSLPLEFTNPKGDLKPKKADTLNSDLMTAGIYTKLDQKSVIAWLDLRNKAAHGHYSEYTKEQVALFLQSVRDFLTRFPA